MILENGQLKNVVDPVDMQDGMTMNSAMSTAAGIPRVYVDSVQQTNVWSCKMHTNTSGGNAVFYLTKDGTSSGIAIFPNNVFLSSLNVITYSSVALYQSSAPTLSNSNKTLTVGINQMTGVSLLNGLINLVTASNGITVYMQIEGN